MRKQNGQFDKGNSFGVGRPKRQVEMEYLRALSDVCPLDVWRSICQRAVEDAVNGDAKSRQWLSEYLLHGATLFDLVKLETVGVSPSDYVRGVADNELNGGNSLSRILKADDGESVMERAIRFARENEHENTGEL